MEGPCGGPFRVGREQPVRKILLVALVSGNSGSKCICLLWEGEPMWVNCPYRLLGRVWRKLKHVGATATVLVPLWESATWCQMGRIFLRLLIGVGTLGSNLSSSCLGQLRVGGTSSRPTSQL